MIIMSRGRRRSRVEDSEGRVRGKGEKVRNIAGKRTTA